MRPINFEDANILDPPKSHTTPKLHKNPNPSHTQKFHIPKTLSMDQVLLVVVDSLKSFTNSAQNLVNSLIHRRDDSNRHNPIEILKRLQREAFQDIMKLRDRQDKVERIISFYKTANGSPFQETSTRVRGEVDILGTLPLKMDNVDSIERAGVRSGVDTRFTFETIVRDKDMLLAEFIAGNKGRKVLEDSSREALSLEKVFYKANVSDWLSVVAVLVGAQYKDLGHGASAAYQEKGFTENSSFKPPFMNQHAGSALGLTVRRLNVVASLGCFVYGRSCLGRLPYLHSQTNSLNTFGEVVCHLPRAKLSLSGLLSKWTDNGALVESTNLSTEPTINPTLSAGTIALALESEVHENTRIAGWIEVKTLNNKRWAISMSNDDEDESGWGLTISGSSEGSHWRDRIQLESYANFKVAKRFNLRPGLVHTTNENTYQTAIILRSNWSL